jgi:hypothetical protein
MVLLQVSLRMGNGRCRETFQMGGLRIDAALGVPVD